MKKIKITICILLTMIMALWMAGPAFAEDGPVFAEEGSLVLHATTSLASGQIIEWDIDYNDGLFDQPQNQYNHSLAKVSLGLAISSFRNTKEEFMPTDSWVRSYLTDAEFTDLFSEGYDETPTEHSISTIIGHKKIGDHIVLAVVACGGGYGDEWLSNFTVGTGARHQGFNEAAEEVESRILNYIRQFNLVGNKLKLWMAGYSRAAAVANITEADMTDSGIFEAVYGYNYATPRTTKNPGEYDNIFNIVGKYDPVPMIPFADWGYERYGIDMFTPAQEMDSNYKQLRKGADMVAQALIGRKLVNSPEINGQLHMLFEYLLQILPTDADYEEFFMEPLKKAWVSDSPEKLFENIMEAVRNMKALDAERQSAADSLLKYLDTVVMAHLRDNAKRAQDGYWESGESIGTNVIREHNPNTYLQWLYAADDPANIFNYNIISKKVIVSGTADVDIYGDEGFIETVKRDGTIVNTLPEGVDEPTMDQVVYAQRKGSQTIISIPGDMEYHLVIRAAKNETFSYLCTTYFSGLVTGETTPLISFDAEKGAEYELWIAPIEKTPILYDEDGNLVQTWRTAFEYSPAMVLQLENLNVFKVSIGTMISILAGSIFCLVLAIIIVIIVSIIHAIKCRKRGRPYSKYHVIVPHLLLILFFFLVGEMTGYLVSSIRIIADISILIASFITVLLAVRGTFRHRCKRNMLICIILFVLAIGNFIWFRFTSVGVICFGQLIYAGTLYIICCAAAIYTFPHEGKKIFKKEKEMSVDNIEAV